MADIQIASRGPRRWWAFESVAREASVGLWRSVSFVAGAGIVTAISAVIAGGAAAAAIFNIAWFFFAAFLICSFSRCSVATAYGVRRSEALAPLRRR